MYFKIEKRIDRIKYFIIAWWLHHMTYMFQMFVEWLHFFYWFNKKIYNFIFFSSYIMISGLFYHHDIFYLCSLKIIKM